MIHNLQTKSALNSSPFSPQIFLFTLELQLSYPNANICRTERFIEPIEQSRSAKLAFLSVFLSGHITRLHLFFQTKVIVVIRF
jgi:hypothetical protein